MGDWTTWGAVNPIKNQGQCGSCWAFSTVGTLESAWQISNGALYSLAEQQLVDCDKSDNGCSGGWPHTAYDSYISRNGYCSEDSYDYTARGGYCRASSCDVKLPRGSVTGHTNVGSSSSGLKSALAKQPVSVTVNAGQLQLYANGVVTGDCRGQINHAVIAVGYGSEGQDYFKIRNSWGTGWGEQGYIRLAQEGGSQGTACLFQYAPVVPTLSTAMVAAVAPYEQEWAEFQAVQGSRNGPIPDAFKANVDAVKAHNAQDSSYTLSYTGPFADLSEDEFIAMYTGLNQPLASEDSPVLSVDDASELEDAVDWTTRGAVNAIKNQGQCGSCWAFSTVGTLESAWQISTGTLYSLAEQQLVDCDRSDNGCSGGWPHTAYDSYISRAGYCSEDSYRYTARDGSCRASSCDVKLAEGSVTGHQNVAQSSSGLKSALAKQPVSVTVNAGQ